jgi:signal transduction histidine kinase/CheY-like chemotaxis protein
VSLDYDPLHTPPNRDYLEAIAQETLPALCLAGLGASYCWLFIMATLIRHDPPQVAGLKLLLPPAILLAASVIGLFSIRLPFHSRSAMFVFALAGCSILNYIWLAGDIWLYVPALVVIIAGLLIGASLSFVSAGILTAAILILHPISAAQHPFSSIVPAVALLWAAAAVSWLSSRNLYTSAAWAWFSHQQALRLLTELRDRQGELNRSLFALTEASRRLDRNNQELALARERAEEARAFKEQFVANVSHELRTPLNLVVGFAEMLYLDPDGYEGACWTPELVSDLGELYRAGQHLQSLVNDILDLSRIDATRLPMFREIQDIRPIIEEALETIAPLVQQQGLFCRIEPGGDAPQLFVDRTRIRQVMLNLLNNAVRFTSSGGITISIESSTDSVIVSVQDTGIGIPSDQMNTLFERFRQAEAGLRSAGGAGLGLALSRQFVELHGGRMWAESQVGAGSTFRFSLPIPGSTPQAVPLLYTPATRHTPTLDAPVIMVDPDPGIAEMLGRYLEDREVWPVRNADEAEDAVESKHPSVIIVNQAPEAAYESWLGGLGETSKRYDVPVVRCSIPSTSWLVHMMGLDDCLTKPLSRETLSRILGQQCHEPSTILIVDDNPGFVSLLTRMLSGLPLAKQVLTAYAGSEALRIAHERRPDLIFLDLLMPDMDGLEVLEKIRSEPSLANTRVIAVTATSFATEALRRRGGHFTLTCPGGIPTDMLLDLMHVVIRRARPRYADGESTEASA